MVSDRWLVVIGTSHLVSAFALFRAASVKVAPLSILAISFYSFFISQAADVAVGACFRIFLIYFIMSDAACCNLGQVGDADDLTVLFSHLLHDERQFSRRWNRKLRCLFHQR